MEHYGIIGWIVIGGIAGAVAKLLMPGRDPGGCIITVLLGVAGALLAGWIGRELGWYTTGQGAGFLALIVAALLGATALAAPAAAQQSTITQTIAGTRLDINATGEVARVPDIAIINAGVTTRASTARSALQQAANRMARVRAALTKAGVADRDIQTSNINLNADYAYENNRAPRLTGYNASNQVTVRFRDIANSGEILDALVAEGANSINGPTLTIDKLEAALDEARARAI